MSTLAYAALTSKREEAPPDSSSKTSPPGVSSYVDSMAALVPAEVLALHAMILSVTTSTATVSNDEVITTITEAATLKGAFWGLLILSAVLYLAPRWKRRVGLDALRVLIPPAAFVVWTMLQRSTAFDAVRPELQAAPRTVVALFAAVVLGLLAAQLAIRADRAAPTKPPAQQPASP